MNFSKNAFKTLGFPVEKQNQREKKRDLPKKSILQLSLEFRFQLVPICKLILHFSLKITDIHKGFSTSAIEAN